MISGVEKKTVAEYQRYLSRDIEPVLGHFPLSTLSRTDISRWVNALQEANTTVLDDDGAGGDETAVATQVGQIETPVG